MINTISPSPMNIVTLMENNNVSESNTLFSSKQYLKICEDEIQNANWVAVLINCHKFLTELPVSHKISDKATPAYANFRQIATVMLAKNHSYDSVVNLLNISNDMTEFTKTFFHQIDKKGVHIPKPKPTKEEVIFIYTYCVNFFNLISVCFNE